jgi:hypothetical protein
MNTIDHMKAHAPKAAEYLALAGKAIMAAIFAYDYARAAEKMVDPNCAGDANPAWQTGPFLNIFHGGQPISRTAPSVLQGSIESQVAAQIVYGSTEDGIQMPENDDSHNQVDHIQAKLAIIEQAALAKWFMTQMNGPTTADAAQTAWPDLDLHAPLGTLAQVYERGDELLMVPDCDTASMREAVDIFYATTQCITEIAAKL